MCRVQRIAITSKGSRAGRACEDIKYMSLDKQSELIAGRH